MLGNKGTKKFYRSGGTRGGQDHFKWDDVKSDKYRENYLGHSVLAPVGRWQKGKDLQWYAKLSKEERDQAVELERQNFRQNDDDLINEALGIVKKRKVADTQLDTVEMKQLLSRGGSERSALDINRVQGLGAAPVKIHEHIERLSYIEKEIKKLQEQASSSSSSSLDEGGGRSKISSRLIELSSQVILEDAAPAGSHFEGESKVLSGLGRRDDENRSEPEEERNHHSKKHKKERKAGKDENKKRKKSHHHGSHKEERRN